MPYIRIAQGLLDLMWHWDYRTITKPRKIFYGWHLVGLSVALLTLMALTVFQGLGTFMVALERQFGWSRTSLSGAFSLARVEGAILGPVEGYLIDRFGNRFMILTGYAILGIGFLTLSGLPFLDSLLGLPDIWPVSGVERIWQFYVSFLIITLGSGIGGWLAVISLVNNWFVRKRTVAMSIAMSGVHLGGFLVPVLAFCIESYGFRITTFFIGIIILLTLMPAGKLIKNRPETYGLLPDGAKATIANSSSTEDTASQEEIDPEFTAKQALKTPAFWILTVVHLSSTVSIVTLSIHLVPAIVDMGNSLSTAASVVLFYTLVALPSQFFFGYIADRVSKPPLIFLCLLLQGLSLGVIAFADELYMAFIFGLLYGIGFGGRIPLLSAIRGDYFGRKAYATIMGLSQFPNNLAMIGAPLFAGYMFDTTGSYFVPFASFSILTFLGAFLVLFVRPPKAITAINCDSKTLE